MRDGETSFQPGRSGGVSSALPYTDEAESSVNLRGDKKVEETKNEERKKDGKGTTPLLNACMIYESNKL